MADTAVHILTSLPRNQKVLDFASLYSPQNTTSSQTGFRRPAAHDSRVNQILYIKGHGKPHRDALSCTSNDSSTARDIEDKTLEMPERLVDESDWCAINEEMLGWHPTSQAEECYTGSSQRNRARRRRPCSINECPVMQFEDVPPKKSQTPQRQTVSECTSQSNDTAHQVVRTVAIQLLESCFTLPSSCYLNRSSSPGCGNDDQALTNSQMISSLRMNLRYGGFGHRHRSVSNTTMWPTAFDGTLTQSSQSIIQKQQKSTIAQSVVHGNDRPDTNLVTDPWHMVVHKNDNLYQLDGTEDYKDNMETYTSPEMIARGRDRRRRARKDSEIESATEGQHHTSNVCPAIDIETPAILQSHDMAEIVLSRSVDRPEYMYAGTLIANRRRMHPECSDHDNRLPDSALVPLNEGVDNEIAVEQLLLPRPSPLESPSIETQFRRIGLCRSGKTSPRRRQPTSQLSEVHTTHEVLSQAAQDDNGTIVLPEQELLDTSEDDVSEEPPNTDPTNKRPSLYRFSPSGTQIFRPSQDGLEVSGVPAGVFFDFFNDGGNASVYI